MSSRSELMKDYKLVAGTILSWLFGIVVIAIGVINMFWGNDPWYGVFIFFLSFVYLPPTTRLLKKISGISVPLIAKIILAVFILWTALGVGELFDKINLVKQTF